MVTIYNFFIQLNVIKRTDTVEGQLLPRSQKNWEKRRKNMLMTFFFFFALAYNSKIAPLRSGPLYPPLLYYEPPPPI
jgi:hypothetical protein